MAQKPLFLIISLFTIKAFFYYYTLNCPIHPEDIMLLRKGKETILKVIQMQSDYDSVVQRIPCALFSTLALF